ncbi:phospholipase D-like domain-containing protein [Nesterenkonia lutea]|uniref:Cardiolipin synthase n=1 Tax=Nesterenkonia lutea TaxID=272919 RepID=A0ABR9JAL6_9MICC|nr:phospholipase D-like domain-containing protein [Nesterenkonia lutea]MBE1522963.1 cardiolipin synthase [Nesterenkonia lutea]
MKPPDLLPRKSPRRVLLRAAPKVAGAALMVPAVAAVSAVAVDLVKRRGRKHRRAPRPGTFHAQVEESQLSIYTDGASLYQDMIEAIDGAQDSVFMEAYIWKNDEVGQRFVDAFNAAADRGVAVYITYDGFANLVVPGSFYRQLTDNIEVYRLPAIIRKAWKGPLRYTAVNHSKVLVVDNKTSFVGGYNIGSLFAREWRDTHLREIGPTAGGLRQTIARKWNEDRPLEEQIPWAPPSSWDPTVQVAANLPMDLVYPIRNMYLKAIERAQHHVLISTPYFIPDQQILGALQRAAERGVDVQVMLPKNSNHVLGDWVSRGFYGQLLDSGISILLYTSSMMHSKTATIDGEWSTIGTANIDRLSLSFNYESNVEIIHQGFAAEMEKVFRSDAAHCEVVDPRQWRDRNPLARATEFALIPFRPLL